ncbi:sugar ABC transporter substrate-binding protein [Litchfieldia alkalitelluris]|uniref:sugar ABC transporter substrate-binding protein n=1 Tax=Litchfieldia alkalitelluris TaxID=304268 RepID=UPI0009968471|nr:maltose ABC transporter substrate-binding protein [Litchfieldia alkalitelluris]
MKKLLSIFLVLGIVFTLVACGSQDETEGNTDTGNNDAEDTATDFEVVPEEGAELTLWSDGDQQLEWATEVAAKFTEEYGIPVTVEEVTQEEAPERLATDGPSGLAADVFGSTHDRIGRAISAGLVLENFWPEEYQEEFMEGAIQATSFEDVLYGYPAGIETYALYYNADLVKEAPQTWDELINVASELTGDDTYGFMMEPANFYFQYGLVGANGGYVFGDNNTDVTDIGLNNEGSVKALEQFLRIRDEIIPGMKTEDITYDVRTALFNEGKLAFDINGPWAAPGYTSAGVNYKVAPLPTVDGTPQSSFSGTRGFYVNAYTEYPDAASLLAQFITNEENLLRSYEVTGALPPRTELLENETIKENPVSVAFLEQATNAVPMPNVPEMPLIWDPIHAAVTDMWNNKADVQKSLDNAVETIKTAISEQQQ